MFLQAAIPTAPGHRSHGRVRGMPGARDRSMEKITKTDLRKLAKIAQVDREDLFRRMPHLRHYRGRVICVALCQGAALHYVDRRNGVKDFDVWTFYAEQKSVFPYRRVGRADFGESKFGRRPKDAKRFVGRRVDLMGRSLRVPPSAQPLKVINEYLSRPRTKSSKRLAKKAVVVIDSPELRGVIAWPKVARRKS